MNIPGLGQISEEEMKLAMEFRTKLAERMAATVVEGSAMGGKVKVTYDGQGQPVKVDISDDALKEGEAAVGAAVTDAQNPRLFGRRQPAPETPALPSGRRGPPAPEAPTLGGEEGADGVARQGQAADDADAGRDRSPAQGRGLSPCFFKTRGL
ncbi:hypothetical protein M885DRAFT_530153 [Pelagophyceae sp. CCMP2097]|nr:hypothetical protein M885DRAFT_530153 [Pelagophyceae sp. CCMP2097]